MSTSLKPMKVWGSGGPNPPKVHILLKELGLEYDVVDIGFDKLKQPEYEAVNPNGRIPALYDPNTDLTLWESGAIVEYLVDKYDTQHKLSFERGSAESYLARQWLYFQVSGQGPYFGQYIWFTRYHPEKVPTATDRYANEIKRVTGVLEKVLAERKKESKGDGPWLVGDRISFADLVFVPWHRLVRMAQEDLVGAKEFPLVNEWVDKMLERESAKATFAELKH